MYVYVAGMLTVMTIASLFCLPIRVKIRVKTGDAARVGRGLQKARR